jgi:glutamate-ammonia-ligase adenylyltransferase
VGRALERLAWLKARPVAGELALGERLNARLAPFVYPRSLDWKALEALRALKEKIDRHAQEARLTQRRAQAEGSPLLGWDVKLGQGGIREIEFVAQALQLVYGGRQPQLRGPATLPTLERLLAAGLLPAADVDVLAESYTFLRLVEHRVQMEGERQTHALPSEEGELWRLGRRLGEGPEGFVARLEGVRGRVQAIFGRLLGGREEGASIPRALQALLDLESVEPESEEAQRLFAEAGFARPRQAAGQWAVLRSRPYGPYAASAPPGLAAVGAQVLVEVARSADPDLALFNVTSLLLSIGARAGWWEALGGAPALLTALVSLLGASRYLSRLLVGNPGLVDKLLVEEGWMTPAGLGRRPVESASRALLEGELAGALEGLESQEARLERLRRFRNRRELRVALADLAGLLGPREVEVALSELAQVCLQAVVEEARLELEVRHGVAWDGQGRRAGFCALALGRLGSRELGYGSDLDLVFLHNGEGRTEGLEPLDCASYFGKLGRRVIAFLSTTLSNGRLYAIDARLRPNGSRGTLVVTLEGFAGYHRGEAALWERQASLRARAVAGDAALGAAAEAVARAQSFQAIPDEAARGRCCGGWTRCGGRWWRALPRGARGGIT